ncbi:MAG: DUF559 domain-containing protein [Geodermatophilaceae bacterium]|nr:DUF559 domain-containing protein [Geodermatophilaceae bacterium]MDQ3465705.1 endonuclease domain-containing protein [Actinomycetota bacterium]
MRSNGAAEVEHVLVRQQGCLTRRQAINAGMTDTEVRELLRSGRWQSVHNGVLHEVGATMDERWRLRAALLTQSPTGSPPPGIALSHSSAACLYGFEGVPADPSVHLVVPRDWVAQHRSEGVRLHRCQIPPQHLDRMYGMPVTSAAWTALSLIRVLPRGRAVVVADAAVRSGWCTLAELSAALPLLAGLRGCVQARDVVGLAREGTDSCQETETRLILVDGGLPKPDVNMRIVNDYGQLLARGELGYRRKLIWLEYDGFAVHTDRQVFRKDRTRQNWLVTRGWFVLRYTDHDVYRARHQIVQDARTALARAPARIAALPPGLSPEADEARRQLGR